MDSLTIRGFRGLDDLTLDGLGRFNLFVGANDVGKTSVIEAILLLCAPLEPLTQGVLQQFRNHPFRDIADLTWVFRGADLDGCITLESHVGDPRLHRRLTITAPRSDITIKGDPIPAGNGATTPSHRSSAPPPRSLRYETSVQLDSGSPRVSVMSTLLDRGDRFERTFDPATPPPGADRVPINVTFIGATASPDPEVIGHVIVNKKSDVLIQYLRSINPRVSDIATVDDTVYVDIALEKMLPLNMFGAGIGRAAQILASSLVQDHRILLIDEIENGLHYRAMRPLLEAILALARERGVQVFATTHRLGILQSLQEILATDDFAADRCAIKCFKLQRDRAGLVRSYRYDHSQFDHCVRHGLEIR